ncbi:unnamed protein product [Sphacelaria rigidula]
MWFAAPFLPFVSIWEQVHRRVQPRDRRSRLSWQLLKWLGFIVFVGAALRMVSSPEARGHMYHRWRSGAKTNASLACCRGRERSRFLQLL